MKTKPFNKSDEAKILKDIKCKISRAADALLENNMSKFQINLDEVNSLKRLWDRRKVADILYNLEKS